ncbi:MAG TPA: HEAT repeat domain-containing protein [Gemmatimonadaceae bacterium]|nr:HEAT repeat domain-containing protein [Gemmatimonadaceae bacterium]
MMKGFALVVVAAFTAGPVSDGPARGVGPASASVTTTSMFSVARQDPADSLYRDGRAALSRSDYSRAAEIFGRLVERFPSSKYTGEALYYLAFSQYRIGGTEKLRSARRVLARLQSEYPNVAKGDASALRTRICGELARRGDEGCAAEVTTSVAEIERAEREAEKRERDVEKREREIEKAERDRDRMADREIGSTGRSTRTGSARSACANENDEDDERVAALNALLQMDAERAMPILMKVLERRDACSAGLRSKAVFLVSQKRTPQTADLLLRVARNDPDQEVREQAVFWLSQVPDERAVDMLQDILRTSRDEGLQNKALFALSQHRSGRGSAILREFATRTEASEELRGQAIFWLGQRPSEENTQFLRSLFSRLTSEELKDKVIFSLSQRRGVGNEKWMMDIVTNTRESVEIRKKALFWAGQSGVGIAEIVPLYNRLNDREMKEQVIFVLSQRKDPAAVDKLLDIAKNDRDSELRKKAIFWLGQSRDPRVQQFLLDLINR